MSYRNDRAAEVKQWRKRSIARSKRGEYKYGWICPKCERVNAPYVDQCLCTPAVAPNPPSQWVWPDTWQPKTLDTDGSGTDLDMGKFTAWNMDRNWELWRKATSDKLRSRTSPGAAVSNGGTDRGMLKHAATLSRGQTMPPTADNT